MKEYFDIVRKILNKGSLKENRTGMDTIAVAGAMFEHDMADGFPLLTSKFMPIGMICSELQFFISGRTSKKWLRDRNNHIWDAWCNPMKVPYGHDKETLKRMEEEDDLGPIYGAQWRKFDQSALRDGIDQFQNMLDRIKEAPDCRRIIVSAWNPRQLHQMALVPCHYGFQVTIINGRINLLWNQRSVDTAKGLPFNIASYAILLLLIALETGYEPGMLIGFLGDVHIYTPHIEKIQEQMERPRHALPTLDILNFTSIYDWDYKDVKLKDYQHGPAIKYELAI